ncbi:cytochrome P450 [Nocardia colli]|uniref:Cytochrome P450 n=1 Tax=Nocardia colli TaxID=2545717 RepID=A0A5N0EB09_9NOCA|nr:cytochrome P450 [Nocardia colli]KAA8885659.1 cytochrome P450 [Nocardia colli]
MTMLERPDEPLPDVLTMPLPDGPHGLEPSIFHRLRRERPVAKVVLPSGDQVWLLTRFGDITAIGSDRRFSRDLTMSGSVRLVGDDFNSVRGGIFNLDPPDHTRVRRTIQKFFSPTAATELQPVIAAHANRLIDAMTAGPNPTDLMRQYAFPLALHMACEVMAVPVEQRRKIIPDIHVQMDLTQESAIIGASTQRMLEFADEVLDSKRAQGAAPDDPISTLIHAHDAGDITTEELRGTVMYLFLTSAEPVTGPTAVAVYTLLRHPDILRSPLRDEAPDRFWDQVVREVLRLHHNSATSLPRVATEDVEIAGVTIAKGDAVITPWIAASCDPSQFKAPDKFRPTRSRGEHSEVTFGTGPHFCLGANIARMHLKTALHTLWSRLPELTLAVRHEDIAWEPPEFLFTRPVELPVSW